MYHTYHVPCTRDNLKISAFVPQEHQIRIISLSRSLHVIVLNNKTNRKNQSLNNLHRQQLAPFNTRQFGIAFPLFFAKEGNHLSESRYFRGWGRYFRDLR